MTEYDRPVFVLEGNPGYAIAIVVLMSQHQHTNAFSKVFVFPDYIVFLSRDKDENTNDRSFI